MKNIHCYASELTNTIYIGETNSDNTEWINKIDKTQEVIEAVRDYLVKECQDEHKSRAGFTWKRKDGKEVQLLLCVLDNGNYT